jgi:hypothetical protein
MRRDAQETAHDIQALLVVLCGSKRLVKRAIDFWLALQ